MDLTDEQVNRIRRRVRRWGRGHFQSYPWRMESDAWLTVVAEVMLQRTRAEQVAKTYNKFKSLYATPGGLLDADREEVLSLVGPLGLRTRVEYLFCMAEIAVQRGGLLPEEMSQLTAIKGIGRYTAAAWLSLHRGKRAVLIDSNVNRWLCRVTGRSYRREVRGVTWLEELAGRLTPARSFREYNYAILDLTMQICRPYSPKCHQCPIRMECQYGERVEAGSKHPRKTAGY